ncbi:MAG: GEVED domain-containing protein, partial [Ferruginibacter sp.]
NQSTYALSGNAKQVFSVPSNQHDWSDIGINNGILYDFDGSSTPEFTHKNLINGSVTYFAPNPSTLVPRQTAVDWSGIIYNVGSPSTIAAGTIVPYLLNGSVGASPQNITFNGVAEVGSWGDAGEAFKPKTDYGDAPATYDAVTVDPGTHEVDNRLRLGLTTGIEWVKQAPFDGTGDGAEEDGLSGTQIISSGVSNYVIGVSVYNQTGATAKLIGWIDINLNGTFEASEAVSATVNSMASQQTVNLLWSGINMPYTPGTFTYMRLRLTSTVNGMTTANPTGFFDNGEIEDYKLHVSIVLPDHDITLKAQKVNSKNVNLIWDVNDENGIAAYELQRSGNGVSWYGITTRSASGNSTAANYSFVDTDPDMPISYFRIRAVKNDGEVKYSNTKQIDFKQASSILVSPNPAKSVSQLTIHSATAGMAQINVLDFSGRVVYNRSVKIIKGETAVDLPVVKQLSSGVYKVRVQLNEEILISTLVVVK